MQLAKKGWKKALRENDALAKGLNVVDKKVVYKAVADAFGMPYADASSYLT
jgi:alanine dehydrogenase